jgi:Tfp pilus assembly protein PilV
MGKLQNNQSGFGIVEVLLLIVLVAMIGGAGYYVYAAQQKTKSTLDSAAISQSEPQKAAKKSTAATQSVTTTTSPNASATKYLNVAELGIRIKLASNIQDAYYIISSKKDENGLPWVNLSAHSLDAYPNCKATTDTGMASLGTFKQGDTDPVQGNFSTAYPDAPKINNLYYYASAIQYDCTQQKDSANYSTVRKELVDTYKTVEKIPS